MSSSRGPELAPAAVEPRRGSLRWAWVVLCLGGAALCPGALAADAPRATVPAPAAGAAGGPAPDVPAAGGPAAGEPELGPAGAAADQEIVVFGELELAKQRALLERDLRALGYRPGKRKEGETVFRPEVAWKPTVVIHDEGFVIIKRTPPRFESYVKSESKLRYLACVPPFTPMCVRIGGIIVTKRKLAHQKSKVAAAIDPDLRDWQGAISGLAMDRRLGVEVPDQLDRLWLQGVPFDGDQPTLPTPLERRAAMLTFWAERACNPEGAQVSELVALYLDEVVQSSTDPVTLAEQGAANQRTICPRSLQLSGLAPATPPPLGGRPAP
jgi:hypothetical protein